MEEDTSWGRPGTSWGVPGRLLGPPGDLLGCPGASRGSSWRVLGLSWGDLFSRLNLIDFGFDFGAQEGVILGAKMGPKWSKHRIQKRRRKKDALDLPFPPPSALSRPGARKPHSFFDLSKLHLFHFIFLLLFCSFLAPSWAPCWSLLGTQVGSILAQYAPKSPLEASFFQKLFF